MDNFPVLTGSETPEQRFERFIDAFADDNPDRLSTIRNYFENGRKLVGDNSPLFIVELTEAQIGQAVNAIPLAGELLEIFPSVSGQHDSVGGPIPHPELGERVPYHSEYMAASTSKPLMLFALLMSVPREVALALTDVTDMRYLPEVSKRRSEDPSVTASREPVKISDLLQKALEYVLSEARSSDRVTREEAEKELIRLAEESGKEVADSDIEKYLLEHTQHPLSFKAFVDLMLHFSANLPLRFLRFYLAEAINDYEQPLRDHVLSTTGEEKATVEDTTVLSLAQNYINFFAPGYTMLSGNIWTQPSPNVGTLQTLAQSFHKIMEQALSTDDPTVIPAKKLIAQALKDNPRDVGFWNDDMNQQVKKIMQQAFPDQEVEPLYVKTGDYPHIRYVKTLAEKGDPCHSIYTVLITVKFKDGTLRTFGLWEKYFSLMEADIDSMDISEPEKDRLKALEEQYSDGLHANNCKEFRSRAINALKSHLQLP